MSIAAQLLPEFDQETAALRSALERAADAHLAWRPHAKSMTLGGLCTHLANTLTWTERILNTTELDLAPAGAPPYKLEELRTRAAILSAFDHNRAAARAALSAAPDAAFAVPWTLLAGGKPIFTLPRGVCLRSFVLSHMIHHRGQLTVYLRLCGLPVPSIYGPSADEGQLG